MDWSGVDDCDVFISCLDSHSDGTHSLQFIFWWASDAMQHFSSSLIKSEEELDMAQNVTLYYNPAYGNLQSRCQMLYLLFQ